MSRGKSPAGTRRAVVRRELAVFSRGSSGLKFNSASPQASAAKTKNRGTVSGAAAGEKASPDVSGGVRGATPGWCGHPAVLWDGVHYAAESRPVRPAIPVRNRHRPDHGSIPVFSNAAGLSIPDGRWGGANRGAPHDGEVPENGGGKDSSRHWQNRWSRETP